MVGDILFGVFQLAGDFLVLCIDDIAATRMAKRRLKHFTKNPQLVSSVSNEPEEGSPYLRNVFVFTHDGKKKRIATDSFAADAEKQINEAVSRYKNEGNPIPA